MDGGVLYRATQTVWVGGTYVVAGKTVTLPAQVGSVCRHLVADEAEPTQASLSLSDAPSVRRKKLSAG